MKPSPSLYQIALENELEHYLIKKGKLTQAQAAEKIGVSRIAVNQLLNGRRRITGLMAVKLERAGFGPNAGYWMKGQADVDIYEAELRLKAAEESASVGSRRRVAHRR